MGPGQNIGMVSRTGRRTSGTKLMRIDYSLGHFLRGVVQFTARYQVSNTSKYPYGVPADGST
jgi:hypothetical protein